MGKRKADMGRKYRELDSKVKIAVSGEEAIRPELLLAFPYERQGTEIEVRVDTEEFSALCPWTGLPDLGRLEVRYVPSRKLLELKSLKLYLLSYRQVGIVQEHAAARILADLVAAVAPRRMSLVLDYRVRGGLHTAVHAEHPRRRGR
ncbi:MAG TPA: preQ(1) synthase [Myxococcota bacterium]|nr:preQ(1) synthase [Myxococcota bacterium]HRY94479.1 preQ(1) synthase [Myxococcota bacterium]HSA20073.1 preQ(1) synthase [Myxococcota bacterium]